MRCRILLSVLLLSSLAVADEPNSDPVLAEKAYNILKDRCSRCHGGSAKQAGIDVLSRENLLQERGSAGSTFHFVVPGDTAASQLIDALDGGDDSYMPKSGSPESKAMTIAEKELLKQWVASGAEFPKRRDVAFISQTQMLKTVREFLLNAKPADRPYLRFYSFTHLQNNAAITELDLRIYQAALSKAINSLSTERDIHLPQPVLNRTRVGDTGNNDTGHHQTGNNDAAIFVIDLRKLGWDKRHLWDEILKHYPYGLTYKFVKDEELKDLSNDVVKFTGSDLPILRADWFIVTATQPPLYHTMLDIPETLMELEHQLQFSIQDNFEHGRLDRSGYAKSGVSQQNRLLERHESTVTPYFWISYDFLPRRAKGDLARFPLGPVFERQAGNLPHEHGRQFRDQAFEHDGGEMIWSLPNGMQAYMLVKGNGERIDAGPVDVVFDRSAVLGTPSIINGISCIYCHRAGMITEFRDEIRDADAVGGEAQQKVLELYPPHEEMQKLVQQDGDLFVRQLEKVIGPFLKAGADVEKSVLDFPEPVGKVAEMYFNDLTPRELSLELGIEKVEELQTAITSSRELKRFGLGTMTQNPPGTLKREKWESLDGTSLMQDVAVELRLGTPRLP